MAFLAGWPPDEQTINKLESRMDDPSIDDAEKKRIAKRLKGLRSGLAKQMPAWYDTASEWVIVKDDYEEAVERARAEGKLLFVNFTGFT